MAVFVSIAAGDVDAKSPVSDALMGQIKENEDALQSTLRDGAAAAQDLIVNNVEVAGDLQVDGNVNIDGTLTVTGFVIPETALIFLGLWD